MAKSSNLYARIEPVIKEQAESVLSDLGIHARLPLNINDLVDSQLDTELEKGLADIKEGRTKSASQVFADIRKDYKL